MSIIFSCSRSQTVEAFLRTRCLICNIMRGLYGNEVGTKFYCKFSGPKSRAA